MKKFLNFIISKIFKIPKVNLDNIYPPVKYEAILSNIVGLHAEININLDTLPVGINPEIIHKREIANLLKEELIPYIRFEINEDCPGCIRYRGSIRVVEDRR